VPVFARWQIGRLDNPAMVRARSQHLRAPEQVFVYFAYEGLPVGKGLRGIGGASAAHPLGPFTRTPPVAEAPAGWHRPSGPGGILDDPEVLFYGGRFHLFHSRKHLQAGDRNCSLDPADPTAPAW
jgi:hypothetical protein